jgi:hypothetical protein
MPYTPLNINVYSAAFSGAMAAMCSPWGSAVVNPSSPSYTRQVAAAAAWAQAVDAAWALITAQQPSGYDSLGLTLMSQTYHSTHPIAPQDLAAFATVTNWTIPARAIVAAVSQGHANLTTIQNITPPPLPNGNRAEGGGNPAVINAGAIRIAGMKLIAKNSGMFLAGFNFRYDAVAADAITFQVQVWTDTVPGVPLTFTDATQTGFGSDGTAQPGNVAVADNGLYVSNIAAGLTVTGGSAMYNANVVAMGATGVTVLDWNGVTGVGSPAVGNEHPTPIGQTLALVVSINNAAARTLGAVSGYMIEL